VQLYKPLFLYVKKRVNIKEDAEDLTQDIFLKLSKADNQNINSIKSWVFSIAKNTIIDYYRKKKISTTEIEDIPFEPEVVDKDAAVELSKCVARFVNELPEEYRSIMTLSELEGVPQKEIAERLNMNYVTVRSKVQRGRKKLKDKISDCCTVFQGGKGGIINFEKNKKCDKNKKC